MDKDKALPASAPVQDLNTLNNRVQKSPEIEQSAPDDEAVERVAFAIMHSDEKMWGTSSGDVKDYRHSAKAAIAALRQEVQK
jgi:hypothetical protein